MGCGRLFSTKGSVILLILSRRLSAARPKLIGPCCVSSGSSGESRVYDSSGDNLPFSDSSGGSDDERVSQVEVVGVELRIGEFGRESDDIEFVDWFLLDPNSSGRLRRSLKSRIGGESSELGWECQNACMPSSCLKTG